MLDDTYGPMRGARARSQRLSQSPMAVTPPPSSGGADPQAQPAPQNVAVARATQPAYRRNPYGGPPNPYEQGGVTGKPPGPLDPGAGAPPAGGAPPAPPATIAHPDSGSLLPIFRQYPNTPAGLEQAFKEHPELAASGVTLSRANSGKIQMPDGRVIDIGRSFGTGGGLDPGWTQWLEPDQGGPPQSGGMGLPSYLGGGYDFTQGALAPGAQSSPLTQQVLQYLAMQLGMGNALQR